MFTNPGRNSRVALRVHRAVCGSCRDGSTWPKSLFTHWAMLTGEVVRLRKLAAAVQSDHQTVRLVALRGGME